MKGPKLKVAYLVAVGRAPFRRARPYCLLDWQGAHSKVAYLVAVGRAPFRRGRPYCLLDWQGARAPIAYLIARGLVQKLTKPGGGTQTVYKK